MNRLTAHRRGPSRRILMMLAVLAVSMKVLIPPGFMAGRSAANDLPFAIVMCTGQGVMTVGSGDRLAGHGQDDAADRAGHDSPCLFAGHALAAPPPNPLVVAEAEFVAYAPSVVAPVSPVAPGRGLAAPPLPARGPPSLLI